MTKLEEVARAKFHPDLGLVLRLFFAVI